MPDESTVFEQLTREMQAEDAVGLLAAAQLGRSVNELSLVVQTTLFDRSIGGLRPQTQYVIQARGLAEHKLTLGLFNRIGFVADHPLLYHHNLPRVRVFVGSPNADPEPLIQAISDAHVQVYDGWRDLEMDLNKLAPLDRVLRAGYGLLGEMPQPFAKAVSAVLTQHGIQHTLMEDDAPPVPMKLLVLDESYLVGADFTAEVAGP
jgi:hypothetical protein